MRIPEQVVILLLVQVLGSCAGSEPLSPAAPEPVATTPAPPPQPTTSSIAVFTDPLTGFSTSDVHDVQGDIVRFNLADELIWVADDIRFAEFIVEGTFISYHHRGDKLFQVRFGTTDSERRAYLSWPDDRRTIVDLSVDARRDLKIVETAVPVPGT